MNEIIKKINLFLTNYSGVSIEILKMNHDINLGKNYKYSTEFCLEMITRTTYNLIGLNNLFKELINHPRLEHTIGIILRSNLLDTITLLYLNTNNKLKKIIDKDWYEKEVKIIYASHIERIFNDYYYKPTEETKKYSNFVFFNGKKWKNNFGKERTAKQMLQNIKSIKSMEIYAKEAYKYWELYSKYEHFGLLTNFLQTQKIEENLKNNLIAISLINKNIILGFQNLKNLNPNVKVPENKYNKLKNYYYLYFDFLIENKILKIPKSLQKKI